MAEDRPRVLVVEDDPDTAESYRLILESGGCEVRHAVTPSAAWKLTKAWRPQLILLDVLLPEGAEGLSFLWELRRSPEVRLAQTPIVITTALHQDTRFRLLPSTTDDSANLEMLPVSAFLNKPVPPATLLATVREALQNGAPRSLPVEPVPPEPAALESEEAEPLEPESTFSLAETSAAEFLDPANCRNGRPVVSPDLDLVEFRTPTGATLVGPAETLRKRGLTDLDSALANCIPLCASWNYAIRRWGGGYQATLENALASLRLMAEMGFHFVEVEGYGRSGVGRLYEERRRVKEKLDDWGLHALIYCFVDSAFVHLDFRRRAREALDRFQNRVLPTAKTLGATMIRVNSFTPSEARYVDPHQSDENGDSKCHLWPPYSDEELLASELHLPREFELRPTWRALVAGCKIAAELARREGLPLLLEPRRRELCETTGDLINLCNEVDFSNFYVVLDTAHANYGEEFLIAVRKLAELPRRPGRILCVHVSDNDGASYLHGTIGAYKHRGGIDWDQFAEFLKRPVFRDHKPFLGPLVVDCGSPGMKDLEQSVILSARRLQEILTAHDIPWLI